MADDDALDHPSTESDESAAAEDATDPAGDDPGADEPGADEQPRSMGRSLLGLLKEATIIVVGALIISTVLRLFVAQMFLIPSGSMENTLQIQDRVLVQKVVQFNRGDVVVFRDPGGWLSQQAAPPRGIVEEALVFVGLLPDESADHLIKRVIGMPGDRVACCDSQGRVTVNGFALDESAYLFSNQAGQNAPSEFPFDVTVPAEHIFLMGDHRSSSRDSRCHLRDPATQGGAAFVPKSAVVGSAMQVVFPFAHWRGLGPPVTFGNVPAPEQTPERAVIRNPGPGC